MKTIRRIICVQQIYTNCLCVSKSRPSIGLMIIVKNLENTFFEQEAHQNIFQLFKNFLRMFIFVIVVVFTVCVCAAFYYLEKFSLLYRMGVSVKIFKTEECIFSLYYCFIYTNMNNLIYMIYIYSDLYNVPNISEVLRNVYGLYSSFHSLLNSLQILSQRKIVENDTCIKMLL